MTTAWMMISWFTGVLLIFDQQRRPQAAWAAADRDRSWWTTMTVIGSFCALGLLCAAAYAIGVLPRFGNGDSVHESFRKRV